MSDFHYLDMFSLGQQLRERKLSPLDITKTMLARIDRLDPTLHAFSCVMREQALAAARQAEEEIGQGKYRGPLHGVPIAVKDLCFTRDAPTASGTRMFRRWVPDYDATVVTRLREAGAIILGKLEMTEGATGGHHPDVTPPVNPWNASAWTGISSSGSGVATAAGLCFAALGSDTGGSIRFPSSCNGLTGIKPTWGRVSRHGIFPLADTLDHIGPMTRSAADAAAILQIIAGEDENDPTALRAPVQDYLNLLDGGVKKMRIGLDEEYALSRTEPSVRKAFEEALAIFKSLGATLVPVRFPPLASVFGPIHALLGAEMGVAHGATYPARADEYGPELRNALSASEAIGGKDVIRAQSQRRLFCAALEHIFDDVDVIATPTLAFEVPTPERAKEMMYDFANIEVFLRFTIPFNASGSPAISVPCGFDPAGLPIGLQLVGPHLAEDKLLRAAHAYQQASTWHQLHPSV